MRKRAVPLLLAAAALLLSIESITILPLPTATAQPLSPALALQPCHVDGLAEEIRCGVHHVFEDRRSRTGRQLAIHVAVLPALRRAPAPDPLFLMAGGPGQGARGMASLADRYFRDIRRHRDIVLVDLRGTGASHALQCARSRDDIAALADGDVAAEMQRCATGLDANPRLYTHHESLADLDEIRGGLGYSQINLWGGSWGTRAALLYALRYPAHVRSVILDGAVALTMEFPRTAAADAHAALERVMADCLADRDCHAAFPEPRGDLRRLLARFTGGVTSITIRHPRTYQPVTLTLSRDIAMDIVRGALYVPKDAAAVMQLVRQAADGDFAPLLAQYLRTASLMSDDMALGATMSVLCSEDLPAAARADFAAAATGSPFGSAYADTWRSRCAAWQAGQRLGEPVDAVSQVPALVLSGGHDPVTPPRAGELMTRHFPRHRHIVVENAAHNASFSGCAPDLIATFIADGHGEALDERCASDVAWPPFVVGTSGTRP